jgi:hypothetical protein
MTMEVQLAYALYKTTQSCNLLICGEIFVMGQWTILLILKEVIINFNINFKKFIF